MGGCPRDDLLLLDGRIDSPPEPEEMVKLIIERPDARLARPNDFETRVSIQNRNGSLILPNLSERTV